MIILVAFLFSVTIYTGINADGYIPSMAVFILSVTTQLIVAGPLLVA